MATVVFDDDFRAGLRTSGNAAWRLRPSGGLAGGDAIARTTPAGLVLDPTGTNPDTGEPCYVFDAAPNSGDNHIKFQMFPAAAAESGGPPGFPVPPGQALTGKVRLAARNFGTKAHPFGESTVTEPDDDLRLTTGGLFAADLTASLVFLLVCTDRRVYAGYERIPGPARGATFCQVVPVAERTPETFHRFALGYDRRTGRFSWEVDGSVVLTHDHLGRRLTDPRASSLLDNGERDDDAELERLLFGLTTFTLLEAAGPRGEAAPAGEPWMWGQGTRLTATDFAVHRS